MKIIFATALYVFCLIGLIETLTEIEHEPLRLILTAACCVGLLVADDIRRGATPAPPPREEEE